MKIVIIGTGNVATVLGRIFRRARHQILQVAGRNLTAASALAKELDAMPVTQWKKLSLHGDIYIIAVSDDALEPLAGKLKLPGKVVAHTAASVSRKVLRGISTHYGVFYPLQSLRKDMTEWPEIPLIIDGSDVLTKKKLGELARSVTKGTVTFAGDTARLKLHVAGVIANNFTNYLYAVAGSFCRKEGLDFNLLYPLIEETATRLSKTSPEKVQTGPAVRRDKATIQKHLALLEKYPDIKKLYRFLSESIAAGKFGRK